MKERKTKTLSLCYSIQAETHVLLFSATDLSFNTYLAISSIRNADVSISLANRPLLNLKIGAFRQILSNVIKFKYKIGDI